MVSPGGLLNSEAAEAASDVYSKEGRRIWFTMA